MNNYLPQNPALQGLKGYSEHPESYGSEDFEKDLQNLKGLTANDIVYIDKTTGHLARATFEDFVNEKQMMAFGKISDNRFSNIVDPETLIGFVGKWKVSAEKCLPVVNYIKQQTHFKVGDTALKALKLKFPDNEKEFKRTIGGVDGAAEKVWRVDSSSSSSSKRMRRTVDDNLDATTDPFADTISQASNEKLPAAEKKEDAKGTGRSAKAKSKGAHGLHKVAKDQPKKMDKKKLTKLRSKFEGIVEGMRVRKAVVMPSDIIPELKKNVHGSLLDPNDVEKIATALCRTLNEASLEGKLQPGTRMELAAGGKLFLIPNFDNVEGISKKDFVGKEISKEKVKAETESVRIPFNCYVELLESGDEIRLIITAPHEQSPYYNTQQMLGEGGLKKVLRGADFSIELKLHKQLLSRPVAVQIPRESFGPEIAESAQMHASIHSKIGGKLPPAPEMITPEGGDPNNAIYIMPEYPTDLYKVAQASTILVGPVNNKTEIEVNMSQKIGILVDVVNDLITYNEKLIVHRDLKPENILAGNITENGKIRLTGHLTDLDLLTEPGNPKGVRIGREYVYHDDACIRGVPSLFTDCYSMGMTLAETVNPHLHHYLTEKSDLTESKLAEVKVNEFILQVASCLHGGNFFLRHIVMEAKTTDQLEAMLEAKIEELEEERSEIEKRLLSEPSDLLKRQLEVLDYHLDALTGLDLESNLIKFAFEDVEITKDVLLDAINKDLENSDKYTPEQQKRMIELKKQIIFTDFAFNMVARVVDDSKKVLKYMEENVLTITPDNFKVGEINLANDQQLKYENIFDETLKDYEIKERLEVRDVKLEPTKIHIGNNGIVTYDGNINAENNVLVIYSKNERHNDFCQSRVNNFLKLRDYNARVRQFVENELKEEATYIMRREPVLKAQQATGHITPAEIKSGLLEVLKEIESA